jgi:hypothetical protein
LANNVNQLNMFLNAYMVQCAWHAQCAQLPNDFAYAEEEEEEEGLQGVFKRLRCNGHQLEKGCCEQLSSDCHSNDGMAARRFLGGPPRIAGYC